MEDEKRASKTLKFLCSYNGKIVLPRHGCADAKLRYAGGLTRVLAVDRSLSFAELMVKIGEFCGFSAALRCQLPDGDLETLISITSDEDLATLIEEYDRASASSSGKIRAVLTPRKSVKTVSPPPSVDLAPRPPPFAAAAKPPVPNPMCFSSGGPHPAARFPAGAPQLAPGFGKVGVKNHYNPCRVQEKSDRVLHHHLHHYHHHVPRSYYWQ